MLLGRDAQNIGEVVFRFDPALYEQCAKVGINRGTIRNALADLELNHGRTFPELADMFGQLDWKSTITPKRWPTPFGTSTTLLRGQGLPDDPEPPHDIIIVGDNDHAWHNPRGAQADVLATCKVAPTCSGRRHTETAADQGYLFNLDATPAAAAITCAAGCRMIRIWKSLTFRNEDALLVLEILTSGTKGPEPDRRRRHPVQRLFRDVAIRNSGAHKGFNPVRMSSAGYLDPKVFEGVYCVPFVRLSETARGRGAE